MAMAVGGKGGAIGDINVTPLIDVLLVLLIIFMVIVPTIPNGLDALAPQANKDQKVDPNVVSRTVVVTIDATRQIQINQQPVDVRDLGSRLEDIFKTRNERVMFVKGDPTLPFSAVAQIIDIAHGVGIDKIGLITKALENQ